MSPSKMQSDLSSRPQSISVWERRFGIMNSNFQKSAMVLSLRQSYFNRPVCGSMVPLHWGTCFVGFFGGLAIACVPLSQKSGKSWIMRKEPSAVKVSSAFLDALLTDLPTLVGRCVCNKRACHTPIKYVSDCSPQADWVCSVALLPLLRGCFARWPPKTQNSHCNTKRCLH